MIPIMIGIVACGDKKGGKGGGSSNGDDSRTTLTTNQILNKAFTSFDADTKKQLLAKTVMHQKLEMTMFMLNMMNTFTLE